MKFSKLLKLFSLLRLDLYVALFYIAFTMPNVMLTQLVQDKHCINTIGANLSECLNLESLGPEDEDLKNRVLTYSTTIVMYDKILFAGPGIFLSIFFGYWIDAYPNHIKYLFVVGSFGSSLSQFVLVLNSYFFRANVKHVFWNALPYALTGGSFVILSGSYTYITRSTQAKYRAVRFAVLDMFYSAAKPLGNAFAGKLVTLNSWFPDQPRNYFVVFATSSILLFFTSIWALILLSDNFERSDDIMTNSNSKLKNKIQKSTDFKSSTKDIFSLKTVTTMIKVCSGKRPHNRRSVLWHLILNMGVVTIGLFDENVIGFQFAQKVYHWDLSYYSYVYAGISMVCTVINILLPAFLVHKLHVPDTTLSVVGSAAFVMSLVISGGYLEPASYFISKSLQIFYGLLSIAIRSIMSRIIDSEEAGQIFALLACIESTAPSFGTFFYSELFNATIQNLPGTAHFAAALLMFYPLVTSIWLDLTRKKWDPIVIEIIDEKESKRKSHTSLGREKC